MRELLPACAAPPRAWWCGARGWPGFEGTAWLAALEQAPGQADRAHRGHAWPHAACPHPSSRILPAAH